MFSKLNLFISQTLLTDSLPGYGISGTYKRVVIRIETQLPPNSYTTNRKGFKKFSPIQYLQTKKDILKFYSIIYNTTVFQAVSKVNVLSNRENSSNLCKLLYFYGK